MNPERLTVVPDPGAVMEIVSGTMILNGRGSIHLHRDDRGVFSLRVRNGMGSVHFDTEAAVQLCADLNAELLLDEAEGRVELGDYLDRVTPSTADFLRDQARSES